MLRVRCGSLDLGPEGLFESLVGTVSGGWLKQKIVCLVGVCVLAACGYRERGLVMLSFGRHCWRRGRKPEHCDTAQRAQY